MVSKIYLHLSKLYVGRLESHPYMFFRRRHQKQNEIALIAIEQACPQPELKQGCHIGIQSGIS